MSPEVTAQLDRFADLLFAANQETNLVSRRLDRASVGALVWSFAQVFDRLSVPVAGKRLLDIGTGGGLPGIPLAIRNPNCAVLLNEVRKRRVIELRDFVQTLKLTNATVVAGDVESPSVRTLLKRRMQLVTAFGVGAPDAMIPIVADLLATSGTGVISAPREPSREEASSWLLQAAMHGCRFDLHPALLDGDRSVATLVRTERAPRALEL